MNAGDGEGDEPGPGRRDADRLRRRPRCPAAPAGVRPTVPLADLDHRQRRRWRRRPASARGSALSSARSHGPITGRGTRVPCEQRRVAAADPRELHHHRVEEVRRTPGWRWRPRPRRGGRTGSDSSAPTTAAISRADERAEQHGQSQRSASWKTVKPPMAAKVPWHSEICPAKPVITVIDRKIVAQDHGLGDEEQPRRRRPG